MIEVCLPAELGAKCQRYPGEQDESHWSAVPKISESERLWVSSLLCATYVTQGQSFKSRNFLFPRP